MLGENEIWKDIKGYEGFYQISNQGRVKSIQKWNNGKRRYEVGEKILTPSDNGNGYLIVGLNRDHKRKSHYVHRLVADAFCPNPDHKSVVNHIDYNRANNNASNLEWVTTKENICYSVERMRKPKLVATNTGERYIHFHKSDKVYRFTFQHKEYGRFKTLEEAIAKRNEVLKGVI